MKQLVMAVLIAGLAGALSLCVFASSVAQAQDRLPLTEAVRQGKVKAEVTGSGLSSVTLIARRIGKEKVRLVVPVGTFFVNTGAAQNMISTTEAIIDLTNQESATVAIGAACANFHRPEPDSASSFTLRSAGEKPELDRLMQVIAKRHPSEVVTQVAIWVVTDDPSRAELDATYQSSSGFFAPASPAAADADIAEARKLLQEAGIDTIRKRLFH